MAFGLENLNRLAIVDSLRVSCDLCVFRIKAELVEKRDRKLGLGAAPPAHAVPSGHDIVFSKTRSTIPCTDRWPVTYDLLQSVTKEVQPSCKDEVFMRLESLDARSSVGTTSVNADALRAEYRADRALHKLTTAELQEEIDETTDVPSFDLATTMGLPISKPCPIGTPGFCCNSDDRPAECQRFGKALHKWTESLKIDRRYRQLLCFESISAPGLPKVRLFVTQSGGLLGADALQGYIGWRPVAGTPIPQHDLIFKPVALPVTILMAKRSSYNKPYIFSGEGLARLLVFIAKAKYGPFRWNMFLINDYRMSAKGRCEVFRLGDRVDLSALGGGVAAPAPGAPVPAPPKSVFEKAKEDIVKRLAGKAVSLSEDKLRQIVEQVADEYASGSDCSSSDFETDDTGGASNGSGDDEELSAKVFAQKKQKVMPSKDFLVAWLQCLSVFFTYTIRGRLW